MNLETDDIFALLVSPPFSSILYPRRETGMPPGNHFFVHGDHICTITLLTIHRFKGLDLIGRVLIFKRLVVSTADLEFSWGRSW